jgi:hypothetical protein
MNNRYINTVSRTALKQKNKSRISRYLLSLRLINDEAKSHDSRTITEGNLTFLSQRNHHNYYQTII